jgi:hypothetical protein
MEINADDLENFEENKKKNKHQKKEKKPKISKRLMMSIIKPPNLPFENNINKITNTEDIKQYIEKTTNAVPEIKTGSKRVIYKIASMPCKDKSDILQKKLEQSEYLNKYLDNALYINYLDALNAHVKAGLCYAYYFTETLLT